MPAALDGLSPAQRTAAAHAGGPLLIVGGAGTGKTRTLVARFAWLVEQGEAPEAILALARSERAADALRRQVEEPIARPYEALAVTTVHDLCARLLREHALAAGIDPFAVAVGARRPARDAAGADRRADDPLARLPRQPGRADRAASCGASTG